MAVDPHPIFDVTKHVHLYTYYNVRYRLGIKYDIHQ